MAAYKNMYEQSIRSDQFDFDLLSYGKTDDSRYYLSSIHQLSLCSFIRWYNVLYYFKVQIDNLSVFVNVAERSHRIAADSSGQIFK